MKLDDLRAAFESQTFDFVDFGAGTGESLSHYERVSGCTGAGVELREEKVRLAQEQGRAVYLGSIFDLPDSVRARFVTADNVLEHLPDFDDVERALAMAKEIASDFFLVRHPAFDDEDYLATLGVRPYWCNWHGHPSHVHLSDFAAMAGRVGVTSWTVQPVGRIHTTADPALIPLSAPQDQMAYDEESHDAKVIVDLDRPVYSAYDILFHFSPEPRARFRYKLPPETVMLKPLLDLDQITGSEPPVAVPRPGAPAKVKDVANALPVGDAALDGARSLRRWARRASGDAPGTDRHHSA